MLLRVCFLYHAPVSSASSEDFSGTNASDASNDNPSRESGTTGIAGTVWMPANNPTALSHPQHGIHTVPAIPVVPDSRLGLSLLASEAFVPEKSSDEADTQVHDTKNKHATTTI